MEIYSAIDDYVLAGQRAEPLDSSTRGIDFSSGVVPAVVNAFEEYMVAHEIGHLVLGHADEPRKRQHSPQIGAPLEVVDKSHFQEFQADMWACKALIDTAPKRKQSDSDLPLAVAGVSLGLGVALLIEASAQKHSVPLGAGHPPATERLYMVEVAYELFGAQEEAYIARRFRELLEEIVSQKYPDAELPPMLARDLNQKLAQVLDSLGIDYSQAKYITDFL